MGAPQTPKPIEEDECVPRVAVVDDVGEGDRKLERRRAAPGPRRRGLDNELEGERRRPRRQPRKRWVRPSLYPQLHQHSHRTSVT